jgi:hypothetical protein
MGMMLLGDELILMLLVLGAISLGRPYGYRENFPGSLGFFLGIWF